MKKEIIRTFNRLGVVIGLAAILTGATFAQANSVTPKVDNTNNEIARRQIKLKAKTRMLRTASIAKALGENVSANNQANYIIGTNFVWAVLSAPRYAKSDKDLTLAIEDLVYLIKSLDGKPEAEVLKETLKSVMQGTASSEQVLKEIIDASVSYSTGLHEEQRWYYSSGITVTNLLVDAYLKDDKAIKKSLTRIQSLIARAPLGTSAEVINAMQSLVSYVSQTTFAANDYNALMEGVKEVSVSINA